MGESKKQDWRDLPLKERIELRGHRAYIGGGDPETWYGIGLLQYHFLIAQGLRPEHRFLDVGCGALRLGQLLIPYLNEGRYFGLEPAEDLVKAGRAREVPDFIFEMKKPAFAHNATFDAAFCGGFDVALAQSIFTHLTLEDIELAFTNLLKHAAPDARFYFTFHEGGDEKNPKGPSHANRGWRYRYDQIEPIGVRCGWALDYIGDWRHPRKQSMVLARPA